MKDDHLDVEVRFTEDETRNSPGMLTGTLIEYEKRSVGRAELFARGALTWPEDGILVNEQHERKAPIVRAVPFVDGDAVKISVKLPNTTRGRDAAVNVKEGVLTGLSVGFRSLSEGMRGGMRLIKSATLVNAGLVDTPEYAEAVVAIRAKRETDGEEILRWL